MVGDGYCESLDMVLDGSLGLLLEAVVVGIRVGLRVGYGDGDVYSCGLWFMVLVTVLIKNLAVAGVTWLVTVLVKLLVAMLLV